MSARVCVVREATVPPDFVLTEQDLHQRSRGHVIHAHPTHGIKSYVLRNVRTLHLSNSRPFSPGCPQRPRAAKPSRGHGPQPGHRLAQLCAAAHPDRPRPQGSGLRHSLFIPFVTL